MPSVRFTRDKRGYEYVYLVHTPTRRGKPGRSRVIYWYRTPPGVRIGRQPFDPEVRRSLEQQYPGVAFDWETIVNTPMPPPDMTEYWRERRKAEKAARQERRAMETEDGGPVQGERQPQDAGNGFHDDAPPRPTSLPVSESVDTSVAAELTAPVASPEAGAATGEQATRKRRRRRGGRKRRGTSADGASASADGQQAGPAEPGASADDEGDADSAPDPSDEPDPSSEEQ